MDKNNVTKPTSKAKSVLKNLLCFWLWTPEQKCKFWGHKWLPTYHNCEFNGIQVKFIGAHCERCQKGYDELMDLIKKRTNYKYNTYSEKYFDNSQ